MSLTVKRLESGAEEKDISEAIALLRRDNDNTVIDDGTEKAIRIKLQRGEAFIEAAYDGTNHIVGAAFSIIHKKEPSVIMYTYEAGDKAVKKSLLSETNNYAGETPVFYEGANVLRREDEARGFRRIRYDNTRPDGDKPIYQWCDGDYHWMIYGDTRPSLEEMKTAIYMQRNFVVLAMQPEAIELNKALAEQVSPELRGDDEYGIVGSIAHAKDMAQENGLMNLLPRLKAPVSKIGR